MKMEIYMANKFYGTRAILIHNYMLTVLDVLLLCAS